MLSKIKKVLVSLALAASLALAPMNVSAATLTKDSKGSTKVTYQKEAALKKAAADADYMVEVPESISFSANKLEEEMELKLLNNDVKKEITITPSFAPDKEIYTDLDESHLVFEESSATFKSDADLESVQKINARLTENGKEAIETAMDENSGEVVIGQINYAVELAEAE